jgi:hypothetical protein
VSRTEWKQNRHGETVLVSDQFGLARKILNAGLMGWRNFRDDKGTEVEFRTQAKGDRLGEDILDLIQPWAIELSNAITERTTLTEQDAKN